MSKFLREEDISMGFRAPLYSVPVCIPECNVCIHRDGPGKCKKLGTPMIFVSESATIARTPS